MNIIPSFIRDLLNPPKAELKPGTVRQLLGEDLFTLLCEISHMRLDDFWREGMFREYRDYNEHTDAISLKQLLHGPIYFSFPNSDVNYRAVVRCYHCFMTDFESVSGLFIHKIPEVIFQILPKALKEKGEEAFGKDDALAKKCADFIISLDALSCKDITEFPGYGVYKKWHEINHPRWQENHPQTGSHIDKQQEDDGQTFSFAQMVTKKSGGRINFPSN